MGRAFWIGVGILLASGSPALAAQCDTWRTGFAFPGPDDYVSDLAVFDDGSGPALYAYGRFTRIDTTPILGIARWDGASWSPVGTGIEANPDYGGELAVFDDGTGPALYLGAHVTLAGSQIETQISRWNGTTWSEVGDGLSDDVTALTVYDDGSGPALYAGGGFTFSGSTTLLHLAKWDGVAWTGVGGGTDGVVTALCVFDEGAGPRLFVGGEFLHAGSQLAPAFARWDGAAWSSVGGGISLGSSDGVYALAVHDDGSGPALFVGGQFTFVGPFPSIVANSIAKWNGSTWSALGQGMHGVVEALQSFDDGSGSALWVAGTFTEAGGAPALRIAKWQASSWVPVGDAGDYVYDLEVFDDGAGEALYLGGKFLSVGGVQAAHVCRRQGPNWSALGPQSLGVEPVVKVELVHDDGTGPSLFVGGSFQRAGGVLSPGIARWDGVAWNPVGTGVDGSVLALAVHDDGSGPALYAGGAFTSAGGIGANRVARWNGSSWSPVGSGMNGSVAAFAVHDDGTGMALYAGGDFSAAGGISANRVAKWNGVAWSNLGAGIPSGTVLSLASFGTGSARSLYVGGNFTSAGGHVVSHIARWNQSVWSSPGGVGGPQPRSVDALLIWDDGAGPKLYAGGKFTTPGASVARWDGTSWSSLADGPGGHVYTLSAIDNGGGRELIAGGSRWDGTSWTSLVPLWKSVYAVAGYDSGSGHGPDVYFGGLFTEMGGVPATNFAELEGCASPGAPFCFGDGSGAACPCANPGASGHGCQNSVGTGGAQLAAFGTTDPDSIALVASAELPSALTVFMQGNAAVAPVRFGDGLRCVGGSLKRLYARSASGGQAVAPGPSDLHVQARSAQLGDVIPSGGVRHYMAFYRDPSPSFCPLSGSTFNGSNAVTIHW